MITATSLARVKPGLRGEDPRHQEFLDREYDHETQTRVAPDGEETQDYPTSTRFDGDST